jgi:hypothetical protein
MQSGLGMGVRIQAPEDFFYLISHGGMIELSAVLIETNLSKNSRFVAL